jgi:hypothetical protein
MEDKAQSKLDEEEYGDWNPGQSQQQHANSSEKSSRIRKSGTHYNTHENTVEVVTGLQSKSYE